MDSYTIVPICIIFWLVSFLMISSYLKSIDKNLEKIADYLNKIEEKEK